MKPIKLAILVLCVFWAAVANGRAEDFTGQIRAINSIDQSYKNSRQAAAAVDELAQSPQALIPTLKAFRDASPLAVNYLTNVVDRLVASQVDGLPTNALVEFVRDRSQSPVARSLAFNALPEDAEVRENLIAGFLDDPSDEFRRLGVAEQIETAKELKKSSDDSALAAYRKAMDFAVHQDQVKLIVKALEEFDQEVDLLRHFGLLTEWKLIGPFDNRGMAGFDVVYPPEEQIDLTATYDGQLGPVSWQPVNTEDDYGIINVADSFENWKGSVVYLTTTFNSAETRKAQVRLGTKNAFKIWLNDEQLFGREEYHRGMRFDQYPMNVTLKPGENRLLLKLLQNEQDQDWAQDYKFQLRVCDETGSAILSNENNQ
ncbi:hypothetical protein [Calycomorphotria hydatis]|uniref:HEAT repeat domain-containing protein n=1 Tax=Calycomorphotria hydatis TaxID=2528027 RepID=A0A517T8Y6_9PLAN|nr:hypothetical protein [Calycomorphotria hydatis]QDT64819.1 hypothetical protein V22_20620 [Calycomorphotria hydatis]